MIRVYVVKVTNPKEVEAVEQVLRAICSEDGVDCKIPRRRASRSKPEEVPDGQE